MPWYVWVVIGGVAVFLILYSTTEDFMGKSGW